MNGTQRRVSKKKPMAPLLEGEEHEFFFPGGLLGFSSYQRFVLSPFRPADQSYSPFFILRTLDGEISFPLIYPHFVLSDYRLSFSPEVLAHLDAGSAADLIILIMTTLRGRLEEMTANLAGPILLSPVSGLGLQLVVDHYPVRYPFIKRRSF